MTTFDHKHCHDGGTLITNFQAKNAHAMHRAIVAFGNEHLKICSAGFSRQGQQLKDYYSLHYIGPSETKEAANIIYLVTMLNALEEQCGMPKMPFPKKFTPDLSTFWRFFEHFQKQEQEKVS